MIAFTKWVILALVFVLLMTFELNYILPYTGFYIMLIIAVINGYMMMRLSEFLDWNIQSDEDLGIKPGIELF